MSTRKAGRGHIVVQDVRAAEADVRCRFLMTQEGHQCPAAAAAPDRGILLCVTHLVPIERFLRAFLMTTEEMIRRHHGAPTITKALPT